jgi:hypothetical protein
LISESFLEQWLTPRSSRLRHLTLFRECFILVVGRWKEIQTTEQGAIIKTNPRVLRIILEEYQDICTHILKVNQQLLALIIAGKIKIDKLDPTWLQKEDCGPENVLFYQKLQKLVHSHPDDDEIQKLDAPLDIILANNLSLDQTGWEVGEVGGPYESCLLCAWLKDEDVPWDREQIDW